MESLLILTGILIVVGTLYWESRKENNTQGFTYLAEQEQKIHTLSLAVDKAKRDVTALLAELEKTGEQVVQDCENTIVQLKSLKATGVVEANDSTMHANQASELKRSKARAKSKQQSTPSASVPVKTNKYEQILALADEGKTVEEIAQTVKVGKGEISLILGLRGKGEAN